MTIILFLCLMETPYRSAIPTHLTGSYRKASPLSTCQAVFARETRYGDNNECHVLSAKALRAGDREGVLFFQQILPRQEIRDCHPEGLPVRFLTELLIMRPDF